VALFVSPESFELKVRELNQIGFWNISLRPISGAIFIKIGRPTFPTSGTLSQTMPFILIHPEDLHKYEIVK